MFKKLLCDKTYCEESDDSGIEDEEDDQEVKENKLVVKDIEEDTLEDILTYLTLDSSLDLDLSSEALLAASGKYELRGLKEECQAFLVETINPTNVGEILLLAHKYSCSLLKEKALAYCRENHAYIIKDYHWSLMESSSPCLYTEATSLVAPETCTKHFLCIKEGSNRYKAECKLADSQKRNKK